MGHITAGTISYGETRKIADYENKTAKVELSFAVADGEDPNGVIDEVIALAKAKFVEMMTDKKVDVPKPAPISAPATPAVVDTPSTPPAAAEVSVPRRGRPPKQVLVPKVVEKTPEFTPGPDPEIIGEPEPKQVGLEDLIDPAPAVEEVPDGVLTKLVSETFGRTKDANAIKALAEKFGIPKGTAIVQMAQDKRAAFLDALSKLQPKAA